MRLFFAVGLQPEAVREVSALQRALQKQASDPGLRWERADHLHYTLQFLGEVSEGQLAELKNVGSLAVVGIEQFSLALNGIGAFPTPRNPRVLWVGAGQGAFELEFLATSLSQKLAAIGFPPDRRGFQPHLTIARAKGASAERAASHLLDAIDVGAVAITKVSAMVLMESVLSPHGSTYSIVEEFPLQATRS